MIVQFFDFEQEDANPHNGTKVSTADELDALLEDARRRASEPFIIKLAGANGYDLGIGIGDVGFVQHQLSDGDPPCLLATPTDAPRLNVTPNKSAYNLAWEYDDEHRIKSPEFLCGGTLTPIPSRYALPFDLAKKIATHFVETGERSPVVAWEVL